MPPPPSSSAPPSSSSASLLAYTHARVCAPEEETETSNEEGIRWDFVGRWGEEEEAKPFSCFSSLMPQPKKLLQLPFDSFFVLNCLVLDIAFAQDGDDTP